MRNIKYILFDCMETLIDLTKLPSLRDYALWAFKGSGSEHYWEDFEEFLEGYKLAKKTIAEKLSEHKEYEISERFEFITRLKLTGCEENKIREITKTLYENFWKTYMLKCYVKDDVRTTLTDLAKEYQLGVVSNFMVKGGVEELLKKNDIIQYFDLIITSIDVGWRKPHPNIYKAAIDKAQTLPGEIVFVGDNYKNDYIGAKKAGFIPVFLDRQGKYCDIHCKISNFYELMEMLK